MPPRGPCGQSALAHFAPPTHRTRRDGVDSPCGPCRLPSRAGREGYAPVPARRAVQRHRPPFQIVATTNVAIKRSCHHEQELLTQANEALDAITINLDRSDHATRKGVTGACLPPSIVWLGRAVKVVFWRTTKWNGVLRGRPPEPPPLTALPSPRDGLLGRRARNLPSGSEGSFG